MISGDGTVNLGSEKTQIHADDVMPVRLNESRALANNGTAPMELIIGIAKDMATKDAMMARPPRPQ